MLSQKVLSLFEKPKNVGIIKLADGVGEAGNIELGQLVKLYVKIEDETIKDAKFKAYGGVLTLACASALTIIVKDMSIDRAKNLTCKEILDYLELEDKNYCNEIDICIDALISALSEYYKNQLI